MLRPSLPRALVLRWVAAPTRPRRSAHGSAPPRAAGYASLTDADVAAFRSLVPDGVLTGEDRVARYNADWLNHWRGSSAVVLRPSTTDQVSAVLRYCSERRLAVCPQGGNTGLVGGSVPVHDEVVLSLEKMNRVHHLDDVSGVLVCEAGCILEVLDNYLADRGFMMPLDLGAKGTCQIGGNISTNAGGLRFLRYGSLRQNVLGLTAVLADGTVVRQMNELRKDNTGYDLKQLFIGAEGTLGIVTEVCLQVPVRPRSTSVALLACPSYDAVQATVGAARRGLAEILSAVEFLDHQSVQALLRFTPNAFPIETTYPFYVVIETQGSSEEHDQAKLTQFLADGMAAGIVADGTLAQSGKDAKALWAWREDAPLAMAKLGHVYKYDISLPVPLMYALVEATRARLAAHGRGDALAHGYGHLGDGNVHLNVVVPSGPDPAVAAILEPFVYEWAHDHRGSVSAEHGIGQAKRSVLHLTKGPECIAMMQALKALLDPRGILNPHKVLPDAAAPPPPP